MHSENVQSMAMSQLLYNMQSTSMSGYVSKPWCGFWNNPSLYAELFSETEEDFIGQAKFRASYEIYWCVFTNLNLNRKIIIQITLI